MEKFQKYCLSVLLVIICSNISPQVCNESAENDDCRQLYEIYSRFLHSGDNEVCSEPCVKEKPGFAIHHKQNAIDSIGKCIVGKQQNSFNKSKTGEGFSEEKYARLLKNFEKNSKESTFAQALYLKIRVSKVRNKDYLSLIG